MTRSHFILALALTLWSRALLAPPIGIDCFGSWTSVKPLKWRKENQQVLGPRVTKIAYPKVPSVEALHLPKAEPQKIDRRGAGLSPGLLDPILEEARELKAFDDFKPLSDLKPRAMSVEDKNALFERAEAAGNAVLAKEGLKGARRAFLRLYIEGAYEAGGKLVEAPDVAQARTKLESGDAQLDAVYGFVEGNWQKLAMRSPDHKDGSLLPTPYSVLVAARGRFHESYYWDTYFMVRALLRTGRLELAQMQAENFLEAIRVHGLVPNGMRDYYLSRSQPPFVSTLVREVVEASLAEAKTDGERERIRKWTVERALPLLRADYEKFWMDESTRYDKKTGLNHHWDDISGQGRPEKHAFDDELSIGKTYRDARAGAEGGRDFTNTQGPEYSRVAGVLLNSLLFKYENDLAFFSSMAGRPMDKKKFETVADRRKEAMVKYLWDESRGRFENYHLDGKGRLPHLSADAFSTPLFVNLLDMKKESDRKKLERILTQLPTLEEKGGLVASEIKDSHHQWDRGRDNSAWAPDQVMAVQGLINYGKEADAFRLAGKWLDTVKKTHARTGGIFERYDVGAQDRPQADDKKYPPQGGRDSGGFGWSNASVAEFALLLHRAKTKPVLTP